MYKIIRLEDSSECEDCGTTYAWGYRIEKDGEIVIDKQPYAYCCGSDDYDSDQAYKDLLELCGIKFEEVFDE